MVHFVDVLLRCCLPLRALVRPTQTGRSPWCGWDLEAHQYHTGTLYNQKHHDTVRFKRSTKMLCHLPGCHPLDSTLHMLSGCQNHFISSMKTERHNVAGRKIIKALSKSPWEAGLDSTDLGSNDRLAQHNLQFFAHALNRTLPPYLFPQSFPKRSRLTSGRPVAILTTPHHAKPTSSSSSSSSRIVLRSRPGTSQRTTATHIEQPHQINAHQRHVHLIKIKYYQETRHGQQLEAAKRQHADLSKNISEKAVTLLTTLLGVGGKEEKKRRNYVGNKNAPYVN
eukprot:1160493-Pelagomonas_calceolata.AAC.9